MNEQKPREFPDVPSTDPRDIPCVRFNAEQTEEIMASDYSLMLFHATRVQALSLESVLRRFGEPEEGMARQVLNAFLRLGVVIKLETQDAYYTAHPGNFPNFTNHTYDVDLEADKDARVFALLKKHAGDREYWKTQNYFSTDGFFTTEQASEIKKKLLDIKFYIKNELNKNASEGKLEGKTFRRHKFYDLVLGLSAFLLIFVGGSGAKASNDPGSQIALTQGQFKAALKNADRIIRNQRLSSNDPGSSIQRSSYNSELAFVQLASLSETAGQNDPFWSNVRDVADSCEKEGLLVATWTELSLKCQYGLYLSLLKDCFENKGHHFCDAVTLMRQ